MSARQRGRSGSIGTAIIQWKVPMKTRVFDTVFGYAFRPLFFLLALQGLLVVPYWALAWLGWLPLPAITADPVIWHAHELLFGFAAAAIAGFLLTAVANWTGRPPVAGAPLMLLAGLWLLARIAWCLPNAAALPAAAALDIAFDVLLLALFARELIAAGNRRNLKILGILLLFTATNAGVYFSLLAGNAYARTWLTAAIYVIIVLITLVGGRIIPLFTANWLRQQALWTKTTAPPPPPAFGAVDIVAAATMIIFAIAALAGRPEAGPLAVVAGLLQAYRLARWQGWRTLREPLLWSLHLGYAWIPVGLFLTGAASLGMVPVSAGIHAFTAGAISTLIVAVSGRVALGHTGRALISHPLLTSCIVLLHGAALARIFAALYPSVTILLYCAASAWLLALAAYGWRYFPILLAPRKTAAQ
jgi:uncharacterized protein involved in response to NO